MELQQTVERYHAALDEFARGHPQPVKTLFASSRFRDGELTSVETLAEYETPDLATLVELERWQAKVSGGDHVVHFELRVTSTFRREDGDWKLVARHADPITSFDPMGPMRMTRSA